jgi:hypothetical protein
MSITRLFRLGIRVAAWATPHVKKWHRERNLNSKEGHRHLESSNWSEAERHLGLALAERGGSNGKERVELWLGLQTAQRHQHKLDEAEQSARQAIDLAAKSWSAGRTVTMDALVEVQLAQSKYAEAEQTIAEIQKLEEAQSKPDHAMLARCSRKLGTALLASDRPAEAMEAFERAAKLSEQVFGPDHLETANTLAELAALHRQHGNQAEAQLSIRRALAIHRAKLGKNSREATQDLNLLAGSLAESGDLAGAMGEYERVLTMHERQIGGDRGALGESQVRLAVLYIHAERPSAARELLIQAVGNLQRAGGEPLIFALETLAEAEEQSGRPVEAKRWQEKALKIAGAAPKTKV